MIMQDDDPNCAKALYEIQQRRLIYFFSLYHLLTMELKMQFNTSVPPGVLHYIFSGYKILRPWLMATRIKKPINDYSLIVNTFQEVLKTGFFVNPPPVEVYSRQLLKFISVVAGNKIGVPIQQRGYPSTSLTNPATEINVPTSSGKPPKPANSSLPQMYPRSFGRNNLNANFSTYSPQSSVNNRFILSEQPRPEYRTTYPASIASSENQKYRHPGLAFSASSHASVPTQASRILPVPGFVNNPLATSQYNGHTDGLAHPSIHYNNIDPNESPSQVRATSTLSKNSPSKPNQPSQPSQILPKVDLPVPTTVDPSDSQFNYQKVYPDVSPYLTPDNIGSAILYSTNDFSKSEPGKPRLNLSLELKLMENNLEKGELGPNLKGDLRNLADFDAISLVSSRFPSLPASSFRPDGSFLKHRRFNDEVMENKEIMEKAIKQLNLSASDAERLRERNRVQVQDDKKLCFSFSKKHPSNHNQLLDKFDKLHGDRKSDPSRKAATETPTPSKAKLPETGQTRNKVILEDKFDENVPLLNHSHNKPTLAHSRKQNSKSPAMSDKDHVQNKKSNDNGTYKDIDLSSIKASKHANEVTVNNDLTRHTEVTYGEQNVKPSPPSAAKSSIEVLGKPINEQKIQGMDHTDSNKKVFSKKLNEGLPERQSIIQTEDGSKQVGEYTNRNSSLVSDKDDKVVNQTNSEITVVSPNRTKRSSVMKNESLKTNNSYVSSTIPTAHSSDIDEQLRNVISLEANVEQNKELDGNKKKRSIESVDKSSDHTGLTNEVPKNQELLNIKMLLNDESHQQISAPTPGEVGEENGDTSDMQSRQTEFSLKSYSADTLQRINKEKESLQSFDTESFEIMISTDEFQSVSHESVNVSNDINDSASDLSKQLKATKINQDHTLTEAPNLQREVETDKQHVYNSLKSLPQGFTEFKCHWASCEATLHSLKTLFIHIKKLHTQSRHDNSTFKCRWSHCSVSLDSKQIDAHIRGHLEAIQHNCSVPGCKKGFSNYQEFQEHLTFSHLPYKFEPAALITTTKSGLQEGNRRTRNNQGDKSAVPGFFLDTSTPIVEPAPSNWYPVPPPGFSPSVFARLSQDNQSKEKTMSSLAKRNVFQSFSGLHNDHMKTSDSDKRSNTSDAQYARVGQVGQLFTTVPKSKCLPSMIIEGTVVQRKNWVVH
ncbi:cryptic loci regulator Clr1 [Schizosaccharomyces octosporus yFS286]|uniref:Cryptic loci regulator Clr1 n=1 Tax=Schizosaccharomyces octosporus (strain yFS286) TaxID=483514 RepID=S9PTM6_SCHOY|nr:cryptic loci regulator Clr1 [Schizosaccharomyces octosporus yFS286]EPX72486.1 cryptic loci regulator Clr1 [Schizosaccharomyces octosporus yFS286]